MSEYRRPQTRGATCFFTVATLGRRGVLTDDGVRPALRRGIRQVQQELPFSVDAWVLLPDHMHCIWRLPEGDADFGRRWGRIKALVTRELECPLIALSRSRRRRHEGGLWQRRFWEHVIRDPEDYRRHMDYIHWNPVKHGYVERAADWPYSTLQRHVRAGLYPLDWGGVGAEVEGSFGE